MDGYLGGSAGLGEAESSLARNELRMPGRCSTFPVEEPGTEVGSEGEGQVEAGALVPESAAWNGQLRRRWATESRALVLAGDRDSEHTEVQNDSTERSFCRAFLISL